MEKLLTNQELADLMGWSIHAVHQRRYRGDSLPVSVKVGNTIRYRPRDVEAWLTEHRMESSIKEHEPAR